MHTRFLFALALILAACQAGAAPPTTAASAPGPTPLEAATQLGAANGLALACGATEVSARARQLMLEHSPRTAEYGTAFEQATQTAFLAQLKASQACPAAGVLALRVESAAAILRGPPAAAE